MIDRRNFLKISSILGAGALVGGVSPYPVKLGVGKSGFKDLFLDDDFRLARTPGMIGGCFCTEHKKEFSEKYVYAEKDWEQLRSSIKTHDLNSTVHDWIDFTCDQLTHSFKAQQKAAHDVETGKLKSKGTQFIYGSNKDKKLNGLRYIPENLKDIFALKNEIIPQLKGIPYVKEDLPAVCAWFPKIKTILLWNLSETKEFFTVKLDNRNYFAVVDALDAELLSV